MTPNPWTPYDLHDPFYEEWRLSNFYRLSPALIARGGPFVKRPGPLTTYCALWTAGGKAHPKGDGIELRASLSDLSKHSGNHRMTVYRHLQQLKEDGRILNIEGLGGHNKKPVFTVPAFDRVLASEDPKRPNSPFVPLPRIWKTGNPAVQEFNGHTLLVYLTLYRLTHPRPPCWTEVPMVDPSNFRSLPAAVMDMTGLPRHGVYSAIKTIHDSHHIIVNGNRWILLQPDVRKRRTDGSAPQWNRAWKDIVEGQELHHCDSSCYTNVVPLLGQTHG